MHKGGFSSKK